MLQIFVNGVSLDLPADISFELVAENRLISQADAFSLSIDIPLKDSPANSSVFGLIWRKDADIYNLRFPALIVTPQLSMSGALAVVGVSEQMISLQFLEGRSAQNSEKSFNEIYVNELELGYTHLPSARRSVSFDDATRRYGEPALGRPADAVALPWVIRDSGEMIHNAVALKNNAIAWQPAWFRNLSDRVAHPPVQENLSYMPYLLTLAIRIADAMGYEHDFSEWEADEHKRNILVCNTLPASLRLRDFSWVLPHWSVNEFFENIETILEGEFDIDHNARRISFRFTDSILDAIPQVVISEVVDEFEVEIDPDPDLDAANSLLLRNVGFADNSSRFWDVHCCDWFVRRRLNEAAGLAKVERVKPTGLYSFHIPGTPDRVRYYDSMVQMMAEIRPLKYNVSSSGGIYDQLLFCRDVKSYFILKVVDLIQASAIAMIGNPDMAGLIPGKWYYVFDVMQCDQFGDCIVRDSDEAARIELKTVPVPVDETGDGASAIFLPYSADEKLEGGQIDLDPDDADTYEQTETFSEISEGAGSRHEYYDKLYIGYWTGGFNYKNLLPVTSNVQLFPDFGFSILKCKSLRLNLDFNRPGARFSSMDETKVYKFSFLSKSLPSARAVFVIKGRRYVCRKISASFSSLGMSEMIEGEFYRL